MYGVPVSTWDRSISDQTSCAGSWRTARPSASYRSYSAAYSSPQHSFRPGQVEGSNSDQVPPASTRFMNRSDSHTA